MLKEESTLAATLFISSECACALMGANEQKQSIRQLDTETEKYHVLITRVRQSKPEAKPRGAVVRLLYFSFLFRADCKYATLIVPTSRNNNRSSSEQGSCDVRLIETKVESLKRARSREIQTRLQRGEVKPITCRSQRGHSRHKATGPFVSGRGRRGSPVIVNTPTSAS